MAWPEIKLNTGAKIPSIGFGTWKIPQENTVQNVISAFSAGFVHIDTAQAYGNEEQVGQALKQASLHAEKHGHPHPQVWVTTKYSGRPWGNGQSIDPLTSVKQSLQKLGVHALDLYLVHTPRLFAETGIAEGWKHIEDLQKHGYTKSIGVSNFTLDDMRELLEGKRSADVQEKYTDNGYDIEKKGHHHHSGPHIVPSVNQIELHPYVWAKYKENVEYCQSKGVVIEAYSPLKPLTSYPGGPVDAPVNSIAEKLGVKPEQVLLAWIKSKGAVALTTSRSPERLEAYISAGSIELDENDVRAIEEAGAQGPPGSITTIKKLRLSTTTKAVILLLWFLAGVFWWSGVQLFLSSLCGK